MPIARTWNEDLFAALDDKERELLNRALEKVISASQDEL
jgi:hypothetical protein